MEKQTAVEWLVEQMKKCNMTVSVHNTSHQNVMDFYKAIEQAKEMEKEQIMNANSCGFSDGINHEKDIPVNFISCEQYYNETYGKDENKSD